MSTISSIASSDIGRSVIRQALRDHPGDIAQAWLQYDRDRCPHVTRVQAMAAPGGDRLVPATQQQIDARNRQLQSGIRPHTGKN